MGLTPWVLVFTMGVLTVGEATFIPVNKAMLGELAPDHARSTYMAVDQIMAFVTMILGGAFITLGGFLPARGMALLFSGLGGSGLLFFRRVASGMEIREKAGLERTDTVPV